jgi:nitrite reductase/ring-hydroxylating ferredoxin subunit
MKRGYKGTILLMASLTLLMFSCSKGSDPTGSSPVPTVSSFNFTINYTKSPYTALATVGGVVYLTGYGYRGLLVYRLSNNQVTVFDRTCTYDLSDNNGILLAQNNVTCICPDCGSEFTLTSGSVVTGPSTIGIQQYNASINVGLGTITISH